MAACACCGAAATVFATMDSARSCEDRPVPVFPPSGELVTYHRCTRCGFLFCSDFDALSDAEMAERIYNAEYVRADPDFLDKRPRHFATVLATLLRAAPPATRALDFGGGSGLLARLMRQAGMLHYDSYDPHFDTAPAPTDRYDVVTAFEVMEHSRDPIATFRAAAASLKPDGVLLFSTLLQPRHVTPSWWYIAPRNGHFSIHSDASLRRVARVLGMRVLTVEDGLHMLYADAAAPLVRAILKDRVGQVLWVASRQGPGAWASSAAQVARLGFVLPALNPRHALRLLAVMASHQGAASS